MRNHLKNARKGLAAVAITIVVVGLIWISLGWLGIGPHELHSTIQSLDTMTALVLVTVLPIFGFSVAIVYVAAGVKFGSELGIFIIACATVVHLAGSYWIAKTFLRHWMEDFLKRRNYQLPKLARKGTASLVLLTALVPGLPYAVRNYLLGMAGIPFRIVLMVCVPVYVIRSTVAILFGEFSGSLTFTKGALLAAFFGLKVLISAYLIQRLRKDWTSNPSVENSAGDLNTVSS
jgi:uncharacterized membrane protein YdjX (TVP38/TMEM64 family)